MRWRDGDRGCEGAEIISRKVLTQTDSFQGQTEIIRAKNFHSFKHDSTLEQEKTHFLYCICLM